MDESNHAKEARRARRATERAALERAEHRRRVRNIALSALVIAALVGAVAAVTAANRTGATSAGAASQAQGELAVGQPAPAFRVRDVVSGRDVTLGSLAGHKTLLFFSEGASCQACLVQAADLQGTSALRDAGIRLVSITTDTASVLGDVAAQYRLRSPVLADSDAQMSLAYGMLGRGGMEHASQDGHAFVLLDARGEVLWQHAYPQMYVPPKQLMSEIGAA